jgi:hypothetical protein
VKLSIEKSKSRNEIKRDYRFLYSFGRGSLKIGAMSLWDSGMICGLAFLTEFISD